MFDLDKWMEILTTMVKNPLRTILTSISVGVGIFILVFLLGMGKGLEAGVQGMFNDDAINSLWVRKGRTSLPYKGNKPNRNVDYKDGDKHWVDNNIEGKEYSSGRLGFWGSTVQWDKEVGTFGLRCVHPEYAIMEKTAMKTGRFINQGDIIEKRKVAVIGQTVVDDLFAKTDPIGEYMKLRGVTFKVVGTFNDIGGRWENQQIYVPLSTGQQVFGSGDKIDMIILTSGDLPVEETMDMSENIESFLKERHHVHPDDNRAIWVKNNNVEFARYVSIFQGINLFVWVLGFLTLLAGIIGVSNIMSIVVRERTREIGIRKAIGATPWSVTSLILQESIFMTFTAGLLGLMFGVLFLNIVANVVEHEFFKNPSINFKACWYALLLLTISGGISGLIPALRASTIRPVEALKED